MKKVKNIFGAMIAGLLLFVLSFALLWWNEGNNARNIATAGYMQKNAIQIEADKINNKNEGSLVAITGQATTNETLQDENIKMPNSLVLDRVVEMYQWKEIEHEDSNDNKTYEYQKEWSKMEIDSNDFHDKKHVNPQFPIKSKRFYAQNANLGAFDLSSNQIEKISPEKEINNLPENRKYSIQDGKYYSGTNIQEPSIGDILISYSYAPSGTYISLIGKQQSNFITSFQYKNRDNHVQYNGKLDKDEIIQKYRKENAFLTMVLRLLGWLLMFLGLKLTTEPIVTIFSFIPFLGRIADSISTFIVFLVSLVLSLATIAIAWFAYRPIVSLLLFGVIVGIIVVIKQKLPKKEV